MESTPRENAALVREFLTEVVAGGDTDALDIFLADDAVEYQPAVENEAGQAPANLVVCRVLAAADVAITIDDVVAAADEVAVRGTVTGTHRESLVDVAPTGRTFEISYAWFCTIENGQIAEIWSLPDGQGLLRELSVRDEERDPDQTRPT